ncbi:MAG: hypothetical protein IKJ78_09840 [Bacteroidales bacterium]|nr:hypothetical protein [Bacteroidales bacterium]
MPAEIGGAEGGGGRQKQKKVAKKVHKILINQKIVVYLPLGKNKATTAITHSFNAKEGVGA